MVTSLWVNDTTGSSRVQIRDFTMEEFSKQIQEITHPELNSPMVEVDIHYSGVNYKDAMAVTGVGKIIRHYPLIPGIDFVGTVTASEESAFTVGDQVILNGWGVGEEFHGGFSTAAKVPAKWLIPLPQTLSQEHAAVFGTAGYTAALAVIAIRQHVSPADGDIIVTGAGGGLGGFATGILSRLGYRVVCATSRPERAEYLKTLGAAEIITIDELLGSKKPLQSARFAGGIDSLGSDALASILAQAKPEGLVASCGLAVGADLNTTVLPFILRGVTLRGINSVYQNLDARKSAWEILAEHQNVLPNFEYQEIGLAEIATASKSIIDGKPLGRYIVNPKK